VAGAVLGDPGIDALVVIFTLIPESELDQEAIFRELMEMQPGKPVAAVLMAGDAGMRMEWKRSLESSGVPTYTSPERALRAMGALVSYARRQALA